MKHLSVIFQTKPPFMEIFQPAMLDYQSVNPIKSHETTIFLWFSYGSPMVFSCLMTPEAIHKSAVSGTPPPVMVETAKAEKNKMPKGLSCIWQRGILRLNVRSTQF